MKSHLVKFSLMYCLFSAACSTLAVNSPVDCIGAPRTRKDAEDLKSRLRVENNESRQVIWSGTSDDGDGLQSAAERTMVSRDQKVDRMVDDFMNTHNIDSIETDEAKRARVRSCILSGNIKRNTVTQKVEMIK